MLIISLNAMPYVSWWLMDLSAIRGLFSCGKTVAADSRGLGLSTNVSDGQ
jgi:hypothetical protein